jgi:hypothetical protein
MFIYSPQLIFKCFIAIVATSLSLQARSSSTSDSDDSYEHVISEERDSMGAETTQEYIASGAAAIIIGVYGYYNTSPDPLIKLIYAATQTAGVLTMGQAIKNKNSPRLSLEIDSRIRQSTDGKYVDIAELKESVRNFKRKGNAAETRTLMYTSTVLSGLYFYNGYRETGKDKTLRNIYYFLGFNFALSGGAAFYRTLKIDSDESSAIISFFPFPTVTYNF